MITLAIYTISLLLDTLFYWLAKLSVQAYFDLAKLTGGVTAFNGELQYVLQRIMVLAGVYALFKLAITLISYVIDPDKTKDASKNGTAIIKNIFVAIVLLALSSTIFEYFGKISDAIITGNNDASVINRIVFGDDGNGDSVRSESSQLIGHIYGLFLKDNGKCTRDPSASGCAEYNKLLNANSVDPNIGTSVDLIIHGFQYVPIISWIAAILILVCFFKFGLELTIRLLKLMVLQIISPIPIIMYIDPKESKRLEIFFKTYLSIWAQLFIRILSVYLAYIICLLLSSGEFIQGIDSGVRWIVEMMIYIGIFTGASQIPKLIDDIIGTKLSSETKGMNFASILGGIVGGTAGAFGGGIAGGMAGAAAGGGFKKMATGILSGSASGLYNGAKAKSVKEAVGGIGKNIQQARGTAGKVASAGIGGYFMGKVDSKSGRNAKIDNKVTEAKNKVDAYEKFKDNVIKDYGKAHGTLENDARYSNAKARFNAYQRQIEDSQMSNYSSARSQELKQKIEDAQKNLNNREAEFLNRIDAAVYTPDEGRAQADYEAFVAGDEYKELQSRVQKAQRDYDAYEATKPQEADQNLLNKYQAEIQAAQKEYEKKAFDWFATTKVKGDPKSIAEKYNKESLYPTLSESEKAYYELSRSNNGEFLETSDMKDNYDREYKTAKDTLKKAEAAQHTDRYKNSKDQK